MSLRAKFTRLDGKEKLVGELNVNSFVIDDHGSVFLERQPRDNNDIITSLNKEYEYLGFFEFGGSFRKRTLTEQLKFTHGSSANGLKVVPLLKVSREGVAYMPFIEGAKTLDKFLESAESTAAAGVIKDIWTDLKRAHSVNIVYGDRWSRNILITQEKQLLHIDFDLEISGGCAKEFEVAQVAYYVGIGLKNANLRKLAHLMTSSVWYDMEMVKHFLARHVEYFKGKPFGDDMGNIQLLVRQIEANHSHIII